MDLGDNTALHCARPRPRGKWGAGGGASAAAALLLLLASPSLSRALSRPRRPPLCASLPTCPSLRAPNPPGAAMRGHVEVVNYLLQSGADRNIRNKQDSLPIDLAKPVWSMSWRACARCRPPPRGPLPLPPGGAADARPPSPLGRVHPGAAGRVTRGRRRRRGCECFNNVLHPTKTKHPRPPPRRHPALRRSVTTSPKWSDGHTGRRRAGHLPLASFS